MNNNNEYDKLDAIMNDVVNVSEKRSVVTDGGFYVVMKLFKFGIWFECYGKMVSFLTVNEPTQQELLMSRLCFHTSVSAINMATLECWAASYDENLVELCLELYRECIASMKKSNDQFDDPTNGSAIMAN